MFFINILSIRHLNKSYDYEDKDNYRQKPTKNQPNFPEESAGTINLKTMGKIFKRFQITKKSEFLSKLLKLVLSKS